jgi:hypothetical protein
MSVEKSIEVLSSVQKEDIKKGNIILDKFIKVKDLLSKLPKSTDVKCAINSCSSVIGAFNEGIDIEDIMQVKKQLMHELSQLVDTDDDNPESTEEDKVTKNAFGSLADLMEKNVRHLSKLPTEDDENKFVAIRVPVIPKLDSPLTPKMLKQAGIKAEYTGGLNQYSEGLKPDRIAGYFIFENQIVLGVKPTTVKELGFTDAREYAVSKTRSLCKAAGVELEIMPSSSTHKNAKGWVFFWFLPTAVISRIDALKGHLRVKTWGLGF